VSPLNHIHQTLNACKFFAFAHPQFRTSQWRFLLTVANEPGLTQTEVAQRLDVTLAAVSRAIDTMGPKGRKDRTNNGKHWVETRRDPEDDRNLLVFITPAGLSFLEQIEEHLYSDK
jgi:DNA-binding MarR family transcriptional regulator